VREGSVGRARSFIQLEGAAARPGEANHSNEIIQNNNSTPHICLSVLNSRFAFIHNSTMIDIRLAVN
jgi:hypothetical protein